MATTGPSWDESKYGPHGPGPMPGFSWSGKPPAGWRNPHLDDPKGPWYQPRPENVYGERPHYDWTYRYNKFRRKDGSTGTIKSDLGKEIDYDWYSKDKEYSKALDEMIRAGNQGFVSPETGMRFDYRAGGKNIGQFGREPERDREKISVAYWWMHEGGRDWFNKTGIWDPKNAPAPKIPEQKVTPAPPPPPPDLSPKPLDVSTSPKPVPGIPSTPPPTPPPIPSIQNQQTPNQVPPLTAGSGLNQNNPMGLNQIPQNSLNQIPYQQNMYWNAPPQWTTGNQFYSPRGVHDNRLFIRNDRRDWTGGTRNYFGRYGNRLTQNNLTV